MTAKYMYDVDKPHRKYARRPFLNKKGIIKVGGGMFIGGILEAPNLVVYIRLSPLDRNQVLFSVCHKDEKGAYYDALFSFTASSTPLTVWRSMPTYSLTPELLTEVVISLVKEVNSLLA